MSSTKLIKRGHAAVLGDDSVGDHRGLAKWTLAGTWCNINPDEQSFRPVIVFPRKPPPFPQTPPMRPSTGRYRAGKRNRLVNRSRPRRPRQSGELVRHTSEVEAFSTRSVARPRLRRIRHPMIGSPAARVWQSDAAAGAGAESGSWSTREEHRANVCQRLCRCSRIAEARRPARSLLDAYGRGLERLTSGGGAYGSDANGSSP